MTNLDARGKSYPLPIVLTERAVRRIAVGESLVVLADDRAFLPDIDAWCKRTGHALVRCAMKDGHFEAVVRRTT
jgi:tRNA 2-thiouridine synthesizing protein A